MSSLSSKFTNKSKIYQSAFLISQTSDIEFKNRKITRIKLFPDFILWQ